MAAINDVIVKPLITEKVSADSEANNRYGFVVNLKANKNQIKNAVEAFYDVKVVAIRTAIIPGKTKRTAKSSTAVST